MIDRVTKDLGIRQLLSYWMTRRWLIFEVWQRIKSLFLRKVKIIKIQYQLEIQKTSRDKYFETFQTKYVTSFSPFVLRNCAMHDPFLNDIYNSKEAEKYFSDIVGEDLRWHKDIVQRRSSKLRPNECLGGCPIRGTPPTWTFRPRWVWTRRFSTGIWTHSPSLSSSMSRTCRKKSRGEAPYWGDTMMGNRHELIRQTFFYQPFSFSQMGPLSLLVFFWQSFMQFVEFLWVKKFAPFKKIVSVSFSMVSSATAGTGFQ